MLQYVHNSAARVLTRPKPWEPITPILARLHWLPVKSRITYKVLLLTYKSHHGLAPQYLSDLLHQPATRRRLRSTGKGLLATPRTDLRTFGDRAFSVAAPTLWNSLPKDIRDSPTLDIFKTALKTHLFSTAYND